MENTTTTTGAGNLSAVRSSSQVIVANDGTELVFWTGKAWANNRGYARWFSPVDAEATIDSIRHKFRPIAGKWSPAGIRFCPIDSVA